MQGRDLRYSTGGQLPPTDKTAVRVRRYASTGKYAVAVSALAGDTILSIAVSVTIVANHSRHATPVFVIYLIEMPTSSVSSISFLLSLILSLDQSSLSIDIANLLKKDQKKEEIVERYSTNFTTNTNCKQNEKDNTSRCFLKVNKAETSADEANQGSLIREDLPGNCLDPSFM
ncbi:hypothetical protein YC2023_027663 [Brassica napus]